MKNIIVPIIKGQEHTLYSEPFFGSGSIFFSLPPSPIEVINDVNGELINFYEVARTQYLALKKEIDESLYSRELHRKARAIYDNPWLFNPIQRAWAVWYQCVTSFAGHLKGAFGIDIKAPHQIGHFIRYKKRFTEEIIERFKNVQIECADAVYVINSRDAETSFFYCDPPYVGTDCSAYPSYTWEDYERLLACLGELKGKFLLSSFSSGMLQEYCKKQNWEIFSVEKRSTINTKKYIKKMELLISNFPQMQQ